MPYIIGTGPSSADAPGWFARLIDRCRSWKPSLPAFRLPAPAATAPQRPAPSRPDGLGNLASLMEPVPDRSDPPRADQRPAAADPPGQFDPTAVQRQATAQAVLDAIANRRSVRAFLPQPVPEIDLIAVLEAARQAPSPTNAQCWSFLVVEGAEIAWLARQIRARGEEMEIPGYRALVGHSADVIAEAPHVILVWNTKRQSRRLARMADLIGPDYAQCYVKAELAAMGCAIQNSWLAAHALGLGVVWVQAGVEREEIINARYGVDAELIGYLPIGYPDRSREPSRRAPRKPPEAIYRFWRGGSAGA